MIPETVVLAEPWWDRMARHGEMGQRVRDLDWAGTSLGPPETWSLALRTAVGICLESRFPMLVVWGPDLVKIYNDGYRAILGSEKHPHALGAPAREVWPEVWDTIGPMFDEVMATGEPTWEEHQRLVIERNGFPEECYFVYGYSALREDDGSVGGVLDVVYETTHEVVSGRRLAVLGRLSSALLDAAGITGVCTVAASALAREPEDLTAVDLYLVVDGRPTLVASNRRGPALHTDDEELRTVVRDQTPVTVGGGTGQPARHRVVPIGQGSGGVEGVMVASLSPLRPFDQDYAQFVDLVAVTVGSALDNAYRQTMELGEYRYISDTLQRAMLTPASDLPTVAARYRPAVGNLAVGGDWYDVIDVGPESRAIVVGDCVGHGLEAATVMAELRSAARALLLEGRDPAGALSGLDQYAATIDGAFCATVACMVINRRDNLATYSVAGHPPPLVVGAGGSRWLDGARGTPLGVVRDARSTAVHQLNDDDVIVLYSDGLVERRGETIDVGLQRLARATEDLYGASVQHIADGLLERLLTPDAADDVIVVVKQVPPRQVG